MIRNVTHYWKFSLSYDKKWNILQKELKVYLIPSRQCPLERRNFWERERVREARGRSKVSEDWRTPTSRELSFFRIEIFLFNQTLIYFEKFFSNFGVCCCFVDIYGVDEPKSSKLQMLSEVHKIWQRLMFYQIFSLIFHILQVL